MNQLKVLTISALSVGLFFAAPFAMAQVDEVVHPNVIVAEGEKFTPQDEGGWKRLRQDDTWASHSYGAMWVTHGALLGAPATSAGSVATQTVNVPAAGQYRVWSKYQSMPYFSYPHKVEVVQDGKVVFSHTYGKPGAPRIYSFSGAYQMKPIGELWWPWGVDHDAAEAPEDLVNLEAGPAEIRLVSVRGQVDGESRAEDTMVDFVLLTDNPTDDYRGYRPYEAASPFTWEAVSATKLYLRFKNTTGEAASLTIHKPIGHYQPVYTDWKKQFSETAPAGQWSKWANIGPEINLLHDEGLRLSVEGAATVPVQFALDAEGDQIVGDVEVVNGEAVIIPMEITWDPDAVVKTTAQHAREVVDACRNQWRTANGGQKPQHLAYFGAMTIDEVKDALGYNTELPDEYEHLPLHGRFCHTWTADQVRQAADLIQDKASQRVISFGDEIGIGEVDYESPEIQAKFTQWLQQKGITAKDLGENPAEARPVKNGHPRLVWYSTLFNQEERFGEFRRRTELTKQLFGDQVLTGANYSPHHLALCYGPVYQWVDIFKHHGMTMFWGEDYIFSIPEVPQILSWMLATARCGVKYHDLPIHWYVMPHGPGQEPEILRRNMVFCIGAGASHIDSFLVGPMEQTTENYVGWGRRENLRVLHESIFDSAEAESLHVGAKIRPARVAIVLSKATDYNESQLNVPKALDPFVSRCDNGPEQINQIICRKDQQMLYLALRHAQFGVELVTEDDIVDLDVLDRFDVVYFAGEWIDHRIVPLLDAWVEQGGVLYATAGIGHLNEFTEPAPEMLSLLGLKEVETQKNLYMVRTLLELPLAKPIDQIRWEADGGAGQTIDAVGMRQRLVPDGARVLGRWSDGTAAVTVRRHGRGKAFAVGTLAGNSYMKSALREQPFSRGGHKTLYHPTDFDPEATRLVRLGIDAVDLEREVECSNPFVEANLLDSEQGTLLTLVNWSNDPQLKDLTVTLKLPHKPSHARSVEQQKNVQLDYVDGVATVTTDLTAADYILLPSE
ncbi:MAG: hypothetical protein MK161_10020 [Pirellulales bacterium]|nr:hypothetical protein [Pirellulales bacterium]